MSSESEATPTPSGDPGASDATLGVPGENETESQPTRRLRRWPALILLVGILGLIAMRTMPTESLMMMMTAFLGPAVGGALMLAWWCFASRAGVKEKIVGVIGFVAIVGIAIALLDDTMLGMATLVMVIPTAVVAFLAALLVFASRPGIRLPIALVAVTVFVSYWETQQLEGLTGRFQPELLWRWEPTAEERYLADLSQRRSSAPTDLAETEVDRTDGAEALDQSQPISFASAPWPAFRGPERNGTLHGVRVSEDWQTQQPKELWRQKIGPGWSSFAVGNGRLFTQEQRGDEEAVVCLDADSGAILWDASYPSRFWEAIGGAGPRATPTLTADALYTLGADGIVLRINPVDGQEVWRRDLKVDAQRDAPQWGFASSPLVVDQKVIVHAGGSDNLGVLAYDVGDGHLVWSSPSGDHSYSSPQQATFGQTSGILMMTNTGVDFIDIQTGEMVWQHDWKVDNYRALQPLVVDDSVYIATALQDGTRRIVVSQSEDGDWKTEEAWTTRQMKPDFNDFVYFNGNLYGFDGSVFACIDAETGERQWKRGRYGNGQVLLLADEGQLLILSEKGEIVLANASPDRLVELAKHSVVEGKTWNHPVVVGDRLFVRNAKEVACFRLPLQ
ncbi:PQQ-binding-like beta-propeller repeat protein [Roseiconus lacunae]|uniref:PQQ-binding-like beta-propeller repeat protein n=1 Tax=Roseiconus lacunae TaxID=2605694 RepID=A0ABT7PP36_9BACT|nr:PQQ-binding-like beta-propeller repeat protein [Roseiconus lacunae]MDM4017911.1 PQQ-binding-like beta-propeller repeat protein [Roseiconus lacunae]